MRSPRTCAAPTPTRRRYGLSSQRCRCGPAGQRRITPVAIPLTHPPCAQAAALAARAAALEQRALWLSCSEADALQHACAVLGSPDACGAASPGDLERTPQERATDAALAQQQRSLKRKKQPGEEEDDPFGLGGFSPLLFAPQRLPEEEREDGRPA